MTIEEAQKIIELCSHDYHDFDRGQPFCIDGYYNLEQLEALLVLARDAAAKEVAA